MATKPSVLILGGLSTCSRSIASFLVPVEGEPLVSHLRIVDKALVQPPLAYIGSDFPQVLQKPNVEYKQLNLTNADAVRTAFEAPTDQEPYKYVIDLTGEIMWDAEQIQIKNTFGIARLVGLEAARRNVKAYVRLTGPYYESKEKGKNDEKQDLKPNGVQGTWWHETLRMLASIENLNLVIIRMASVYGPYMDFGTVIKYLAIGQTYAYMGTPVLLPHKPGEYASHTVHVDDVAGAVWACAEWMSNLGRAEADRVAGEQLVFHNEKSKVKEVEGMVPHDKKCIAPLFNIEDDHNTTMAELGTVCTGYFGGSMKFHDAATNAAINAALKISPDSILQEINNDHTSTWLELNLKSDPPVDQRTSRWFHCYLNAQMLKRNVIAFNADKIKNVIGYKIRRPHINNETIGEIVTKLRAEHSWPTIPSA